MSASVSFGYNFTIFIEIWEGISDYVSVFFIYIFIILNRIQVGKNIKIKDLSAANIHSSFATS